jgi:hypothetical protein
MEENIKISEEEKNVLYWLFCGNSMQVLPGPPKTYYIRRGACSYIDHIPESIVLSLVEKRAIRPLGLSIKEWKVQIALGVESPDIEFELTKLGERLGTSHLARAEKRRLKKGI